LAAGAFYEDLAPLMQVAAVKPGVGSSSSSSVMGSSPDFVEATPADEAGVTHGAAGAAAACVERLIAGSPRKILGGLYDLPAQQHFYMETQVGHYSGVWEVGRRACNNHTGRVFGLVCVNIQVGMHLPFLPCQLVT
jgi:hypothetical protein